MNSNKFKTLSGKIHEQWVSDVLGIPWNPGIGPDSIDDVVFLETKSHLLGHAGKSPEYLSWTADEDQVQYPTREEWNHLTFYWALGSFRMIKPVSEIPNDAKKEYIAPLIYERNFWVVPWQWALQFDKHKNAYSTLRYLIPFPKRENRDPLPSTYKSYSIDGGKIHLTTGTKRSHFPGL